MHLAKLVETPVTSPCPSSYNACDDVIYAANRTPLRQWSGRIKRKLIEVLHFLLEADVGLEMRARGRVLKWYFSLTMPTSL